MDKYTGKLDSSDKTVTVDAYSFIILDPSFSYDNNNINTIAITACVANDQELTAILTTNDSI